MNQVRTHAMLSFDHVEDLYLLFRRRELSFELDILLPECGDRLFEPLARLFQLCDELPRLLVGILEEK